MFMSRVLQFVLIAALGLSACRDTERTTTTTDSLSVTGRSDDNEIPEPKVEDPLTTDTVSTSELKSDLPPATDPVSPDRLSSYLPSLDGYTAEDVQKETRIRSNVRLSRATQVFKQGEKKFTVTVNDFAYVPSNYTPFEQFRSGSYLQDDSEERTEKTTLGGYEAVQTWLKKQNRAELTIFPGKRYVVQVVGDNLTSVNEARMIAEKIDLRAIEGAE